MTLRKPDGSTPEDRQAVFKALADNLHLRDTKRMGLNHPLMKTTLITRADLGKIFIVKPDNTTVYILPHKEFLKIPIDDIGSWVQIGEFDVNQW